MDRTVYTSCTLDCPDGCGIKVTVRDGRIVKLQGDADHEFTRGYLCAKTYHYPERVYSTERQLYPLRRKNLATGADWEQFPLLGNYIFRLPRNLPRRFF